MKPNLFPRNQLSALRPLSVTVIAMLAFLTVESRAGTGYVISTDGLPLSPDYLAGIYAVVFGIPQPGFVFLNPSSTIPINGTPVNFAGFSNNTATFAIAGTLDLKPGDRIYGVGTNFLRLLVAENANVQAGSSILASAVLNVPGPGGGAGGSWQNNSYDASLVAAGGDGGQGWVTCGGGRGQPGDTNFYAGSSFVLLEHPIRGAAGGAPARGFTRPGPAGTQVDWDPSAVRVAAGAGGSGGGDQNYNGTPGDDGTPGLMGHKGISGNPGSSATLISGWSDQGGLYGGAGGAGGDQGTSGLPGSGGGGGGGGGGALGLNAAGEIQVFACGGGGGSGGKGGYGGVGGGGGAGGGGGGGVEIIVRGNLTLAGEIHARGAAGNAGSTGLAGQPRTSGANGAAGTEVQNAAGTFIGGQGGNGGPGGAGGLGGDGTRGGGGAGGTISIAANTIQFGNAAVLDVAGGAGDAGTAPVGIIRYRSEDGVHANGLGASASSANPYCSYPGPGLGDPSANTANMDILYTTTGNAGGELVGGPDTFGLLAADAAGTTADTSYSGTIASLFPPPPNALGVVVRVNSTFPLPTLTFINLTAAALVQPALAVNRPGDQIQAAPTPLQVRGYARDPLVVPGAPGAQTLTSLAPSNTWITFLHPGDATTTASFIPYNNPASVSLAMSGTNGTIPILWLLDTGLLSVQVASRLEVVADRQTKPGFLFGQTRAGVPGAVTVPIRNAGSPASLMSSVPGSDVIFSNLPPSPQPSLNVNWVVGTSTNLGVLQPPPTFKVASDAGTVNLTANMNVMGPLPLFTLTGGGNAGQVQAGQPATLMFTALNNFQVDPSGFIPPPHVLYDLNILGMAVSGPDAAFFTVTGPTNGFAPLNIGANPNPWTSTIVFHPDSPRAYNATLSVLTDVNAVAGQPGQVFTYQLSGSLAGISISVQPADALAQPGGTASFHVSAQGLGASSTLTYQWFRGTNPVLNATNATYTTGPLTVSDNGATFYCTVSATPFAVSSGTANLLVVDTSTPYPQAVLADHPLFYYRFEEPNNVATAYDSSGNGRNGVYVTDGAHAPSATPVLGSSAVFHGSSNPGVILGADLGLLPRFTVEAWVRLNSWNTESGQNGISSIFSTPEFNQGSFRLGMVNSNQFQFSSKGASGGGSTNDFLAADPSYTTNTWFHLVAVYDPTSSRSFDFYVNGNFARSVPLDAGGPVLFSYPTIGCWLRLDEYFHQFLDGQVDEVAVYGTPLTAERIDAHYQAAFESVLGPVINYVRQGNSLQLSWSTGFILQQTTNLISPSWSDIPGATLSPYPVTIRPGQRFFRLRKL